MWRSVTNLRVVTLGDRTWEDSILSPDQILAVVPPAAAISPVLQTAQGAEPELSSSTQRASLQDLLGT